MQWPPIDESVRIQLEEGVHIKIDVCNKRYFGRNKGGVVRRACWGGRHHKVEEAWAEVCNWVGVDPGCIELRELVQRAIDAKQLEDALNALIE